MKRNLLVLLTFLSLLAFTAPLIYADEESVPAPSDPPTPVPDDPPPSDPPPSQ